MQRSQEVRRSLTQGVVFCLIWDRLSREGACDPLGGDEFHRLLSEWSNHNFPADVEKFIRTNAYMPAREPPAEDPPAEDPLADERNTEPVAAQRKRFAGKML